jgi:hypothetical protein
MDGACDENRNLGLFPYYGEVGHLGKKLGYRSSLCNGVLFVPLSEVGE